MSTNTPPASHDALLDEAIRTVLARLGAEDAEGRGAATFLWMAAKAVRARAIPPMVADTPSAPLTDLAGVSHPDPLVLVAGALSGADLRLDPLAALKEAIASGQVTLPDDLRFAPPGAGRGTRACDCRTCRPITAEDMRFVVCAICGNKRCPHANDHRHACTGSNEPGQPGSAYP